MAEREYTRLTWPRRRRFGLAPAFPSARASLWLGADHILHLRTSLASEDYKRFFFRDIQALTIIATKRRMHLNIVFASLLVFSLLISVSFRLTTPGSGPRLLEFLALLLFGLPLLINTLMGPTCDVHLKTAVQTELLHSLSRIRRAHRVIHRIRPLISTAQGQISPEELGAQLRAVAMPVQLWRSTLTSPLGLSSLIKKPPQAPVADTTETDAP